MTTLTKMNIVKKLVKKTNIPQKLAKTLINANLKNIKECLEAGNELQVTGFGLFKILHKAPRVGRNPKTNEIHEVSERTIVSFIPTKGFRQMLKTD